LEKRREEERRGEEKEKGKECSTKEDAC